MPHPNTILSINPPKILENIIETNKPDTLHLYVDFKNACTALFVDDVVQEIVHNSDSHRSIDSSIFQSVLTFSVFWKRYAYNHNLKFKIFFCCDKGTSTYHQNIDKDYKKNRRIGWADLPSYYNDLAEIKRLNTDLAEKVANTIPDVYFFQMNNLESDFVPYYLITRKFPEKSTLNIVFSSDKDLYQCARTPNTIMMYKNRGSVFMLDNKTVVSQYAKIDASSPKTKAKKIEQVRNFDLDFLSAMMAIIGDAGDGVPGIKRVGPVRALDLYSDKDKVREFLGTFDELVRRVVNDNGMFIPSDDVSVLDKINEIGGLWKEILDNNDMVTRAFKLISFEALCKWMEEGPSVKCDEYIKYIDTILDKSKFALVDSAETFMQGMSGMKDSYLEENDIKMLFR